MPVLKPGALSRALKVERMALEGASLGYKSNARTAYWRYRLREALSSTHASISDADGRPTESAPFFANLSARSFLRPDTTPAIQLAEQRGSRELGP